MFVQLEEVAAARPVCHACSHWQEACIRLTLLIGRCRSQSSIQGTWSALAAFAWQPAAAPLVAALAGRIRQRTLGVLSSAYSTILAPRAAAFLGLPETDAIARE